MVSFHSRILIFEWFCGGGCWCDDVQPQSQSELYDQGSTMLFAAAHDFQVAGFQVSTILDHRLQLDTVENAARVTSCAELTETLRQLADECEFLLVIAPEENNRLVDCLGWLESCRAKWLNPDLKFTESASNKNKIQNDLLEAGICVPDGNAGNKWLLEYGYSDRTSFVVKPVDGCGGQDNVLVSKQQIIENSLQWLTKRYRIEEFVPGDSVSATVVSAGNGEIEIMRPLRQHFVSNTIGKFSHCSDDLPGELIERTVCLVNNAVQCLPEFTGIIGIDCVLGDKDAVVDVNPRVTASYGITGSPAAWLSKRIILCE